MTVLDTIGNTSIVQPHWVAPDGGARIFSEGVGFGGERPLRDAPLVNETIDICTGGR